MKEAKYDFDWLIIGDFLSNRGHAQTFGIGENTVTKENHQLKISYSTVLKTMFHRY